MDTDNPQQHLAEQYLTTTHTSLFLTGKAGTGKTTFLHHIVQTINKRCVVVAPTGVAAINAGGVTIHSFFQLPLCPYLPDVKELVTEYQLPNNKHKLRKEKLKIIRSLDLLIIDEISMVRADLLDAIDNRLREVRRNSRPFGGVQLLMIGDVQQLPPVVTDREKPYLDRVYASPFFFESKALRKTNYLTIELSTVYRQQDPTFVTLLNKIRDNHFDTLTLQTLNQRHRPNFDPADSEHYIRLTTHNRQADSINHRKIDELQSKAHTFKATIEGNFPESSAPTDIELVLKEGAQVMFLKNDSSINHAFYNGKIATITQIDSEGIIATDEEGTEIKVPEEVWENIKYEVDPDDKLIKQRIDGTFKQYPLRLAWAVTIHKAQGLTFDRVIIDAADAFAYGQVYVALSRCRTLEGLVLSSAISSSCAFDNSNVVQFTATFPSPEMVANSLQQQQTQYLYDTLHELFDFSSIQRSLDKLNYLYRQHLHSLYPTQSETLATLCSHNIVDIMSVAEKFHRQLMNLIQLNDPSQLQQRVAKGAAYFAEQLSEVAKPLYHILQVELTNQQVAKDRDDQAEPLLEALTLTRRCLDTFAEEGFSVERYLKVKADYYLDKEKPKVKETVKEKEKKSSAASYGDLHHPKLATMLTAWRKQKYQELNVPAYVVLSQKALLGIADTLPKDKKALLKISGIGKQKVETYGTEILEVIAHYCHQQDLPFPNADQCRIDN